MEPDGVGAGGEPTAAAAHDATPDELLTVLQAAERSVVSLPPASQTRGSLAEWSAVLAACQRVVNAATAVQDQAITALAAIEAEELDDGTVIEIHHAAGHVALDAPAVVSGALTVSAVHAERRVRSAVRLAADGPAGTPTETGLAGLHEAMRRGDLDSYRAGVVAEELEEAPPEVAAAVVSALAAHLHTDEAPRLRRRCRQVLSRISPDLLRQRARRARQRCSLRRWAEEPGVDRWDGTFPSEDAARAWAAVDALAQRLVADGSCEGIERARAQALIDLVTGSATIETVVTLTVPAADTGAVVSRRHAGVTGFRTGTESTTTRADDEGAPSATATASADEPAAEEAVRSSPHDLLEVSLGCNTQPVLVPRGFVDRLVDGGGTVVTQRCDPDTGALVTGVASGGYRPPPGLAALVRQRDARCRFPGCHVNARFCDLDHVRPWPGGPTSAANLLSLCRRHHRIKQRLGWRLRLGPDAVATWTDPTGLQRTTHPVDALHAVVLRDPSRSAEESIRPAATALPTRASPIDEHSAVEFRLEHLTAGITQAEFVRMATVLPDRRNPAGPGRRLTVDLRDSGAPHVPGPPAAGDPWPRDPRHRTSTRPRRRRHTSDEPPF